MNIYSIILIILSPLLFAACTTEPGESRENTSTINNPLPECPDSPNCVRKSVTLLSGTNEVAAAVKKALEEMKASTIDVEGLSIQAVFTIPVFGWKDDVSINISANSSGSGSILYLRSASREGYWDLGVNNRRVKKLISKTKENLTQ